MKQFCDILTCSFLSVHSPQPNHEARGPPLVSRPLNSVYSQLPSPSETCRDDKEPHSAWRRAELQEALSKLNRDNFHTVRGPINLHGVMLSLRVNPDKLVTAFSCSV